MPNKRKSLEKRFRRLFILILSIFLLAQMSLYLQGCNRAKGSYYQSKGSIDSLYDLIHDKVAVSTSDTIGIRLLAGCVVDKIKSKYPRGISNISKDSIESVYKTAVKECTKNIIVHFYWSEDADSSIRHGLMNAPWMSKIPIEKQEPLCDCYLTELKKNYPNGVSTSIPKGVKDSLILMCGQSVLKK